MSDSTKYSGTCKAPFLLKDETHCISRLSSSETASTTLDITRGTKSLEMVNTWFLQKKNHEHNTYINRNIFYGNTSVKSIKHFQRTTSFLSMDKKISKQLEYKGFLLMLVLHCDKPPLLIAMLAIWYVIMTTSLQCLKAARLQNMCSRLMDGGSQVVVQTAVLKIASLIQGCATDWPNYTFSHFLPMYFAISSRILSIWPLPNS